VVWQPWDANSAVGILKPITSVEEALAAIETIVSQGEGVAKLNPKDISDKTYAHFFKFEEIYCGHHLKEIGNHTYGYSGSRIFFDSVGVAPM
jgi:hypothetical protein